MRLLHKSRPLLQHHPSFFSTTCLSQARPKPTLTKTTHSPELEAMRAAEVRDAGLRAARLRRAAQKKEQVVEEERERGRRREWQTRYNSTARKWTLGMIATPIALVTSYYLFDRCEFLPFFSLGFFISFWLIWLYSGFGE